MTWVVAGAIACAVLVVLAGLLIGRAMRATDSAQTAARTTTRRTVTGQPTCSCGAELCVARTATDTPAPTPHRSEADDR